MKRHVPATPPSTVLVVCMKRIGDVLTVTPLIRSLRRAWPDAAIDVLVPASTAPVLAGNPDIRQVIVEPVRDRGAQWRLLRGLWRRYDLSVATQFNDRPYLYALAAGRRRAMIVPPPTEPGARLKRWLAHGWCQVGLGERHAVDQYLQLADVLGVPRVSTVVPPQPVASAAVDALLGDGWAARRRFAVVHPAPMYRYKRWTTDGWVATVAHLVTARDLDVVVTGGPSDVDRGLVDELLRSLAPPVRARVVDACGGLSLADLALLLRHARAYAGPDTSVTHLAAACGTPTLALFGPSHPIAWGPWPAAGTADGRSPWAMRGALQRSGNVWLVQGEGSCVPCLQEGCERHVDSPALCLERLAPGRVAQVLDAALGGTTAP